MVGTILDKKYKSKQLKISATTFDTLRYIVLTFLGISFALNNVALGIYPLSIAFLSALNGVTYIYGLLGTIIGTFLIGDIILVSKYMSMILIFTATKFILGNVIMAQKVYNINIIAIVISVAIPELANFIYLPFTFYAFVSFVAEVAISIIFSCVFVSCQSIFKFKFDYSIKNILLLNTLIIISTSSIDGIVNLPLSISVIVICYLCLMFNYIFKNLDYIMFCGTYAFLITIFFPEKAYITGALMLFAIGHMYIDNVGKIVKSLIFFLAFMVCFFRLSNDSNIHYIFEPLIAVIIFLLTPKIDKMSAYTSKGINSKKKIDINEYLSNQLGVISYSLESISFDVNMFNERVSMISVNDMSSVYTKTMEDICKKCSNKLECSTNHYNELFDCFNKLGKKLMYNQHINIENSHSFLKNICQHPQDIIETLKHNYNVFLSMNQNKSASNVYKENIVKQFSFIGQAVKNIGKNLYDIDYLDLEMAEKIQDLFKNHNISLDNVYVAVEKDGLKIVNMSMPYTANNKKDMRFLRDEISKKLKLDMEMPITNYTQNGINLVFLQKANININSYIYQLSKKDNDINGDTAGVFNDICGNINLVICDGMGSGEKAHIESSMTMNMVEKLIKTGIHKNNSIDIVNSALLSKNSEESFSTIDLVSINTFTGKTDIFKAGGVTTFIKKGKEILAISSPSMPVGILCKVNYSESTLQLKNRDMLVMVSDGILNTGESWVESIIGTYKGRSPKELAVMIGDNAKMRNREMNPDDISVIVCYIENVI